MSRSPERWLVFNGDADGICGAHQLRLAGHPAGRLVTGVKRDIRLLERVDARRGDDVTVVDVSLDSNRAALAAMLDAEVRVEWFDHHFAGAIPASPMLSAHIDTAAETCSGLIVDRVLGGKFRRWAVVAAYGDNLHRAARAAGNDLDEPELESLRELGELINYNAYGESVADLHVAPDRLFARLGDYPEPLEFARRDDIVVALRAGYASDMAQAARLRSVRERTGSAVYVLPDAAWARRVNGVFANSLARADPERAHAVLVARGATYLVSVRAPKADPRGADALCHGFASGGGRPAAAGINSLPDGDMDRFLTAFERQFSSAAVRS